MDGLTPEVLLGLLKSEKGISEEQLGRRGDGVMRGMVAELLYRYCNTTQRQIGGLLGGIDYVSVHQLRRRFRQKMTGDKNLLKRYKKLEARIKHACTL
ncbi:hypothetical protein A2Y85_07165 [candidate division WOR-3 bacterium RBG_13_43_14]|uniref:Chromosomal replication initiator DnaA C-terminal domain-containing protein n=1 Tax=candidate division WOR-3 bacterium RBG_13_43_14 TaxID=1802590 RepID=A0A1F4UA45_UNCW3|nr:MAG: hypothetical protein A2Y85_07165 [candidate division WOR-3 bacterium RBG_13_43_14]